MKNTSQNKQKQTISILVVESNKTHQFLLQEVLKRKGDYQLFFASNKDEVDNWLYSETIFDLIIIEPRIPETNGYDLIKYLKDKRKDTPLMALTVCAMCDERRKFFEYGCDAYISKPYIPNVLILKLKELLG